MVDRPDRRQEAKRKKIARNQFMRKLRRCNEFGQRQYGVLRTQTQTHQARPKVPKVFWKILLSRLHVVMATIENLIDSGGQSVGRLRLRLHIECASVSFPIAIARKLENLNENQTHRRWRREFLLSLETFSGNRYLSFAENASTKFYLLAFYCIR